MSHTHHHHGHHHHIPSGKKLLGVIVLNILITVSQLIGAIFSGSLALLSDAMHNFSDVAALVISYIANRLSRKNYTASKSYGYKRAEIVAALINTTALIGIGIYILVEAIGRLISTHTEEVHGMTVVWLATFSIAANGLSVILLSQDAKHNMNMRSAYLHLLTDTLSSVAVLAGGLMTYYYQIYWVDSVLSIMIAVLLIYSSWGLMTETIHVIMQFAPSNIDLVELEKRIEKIPGIKDMHHAHIWQLNDQEIHFQAHIDLVEDLKTSENCKLMNEVEMILHNEFGIDHIILQAEYGTTDDKKLIVQDHI
ncbi:cation diffusion facilitator family transporter [Sediminitomix flava]|uniref:Cobalt-zinc-cadmium efflux system protein n=1 Tax=Sediminitomix flava TaxID=379075 RepID=A0A315Z8A8_SEDFL|nr:cation diffusion facilitator family transporter [Sediminitomix flava]PWJ40795.1 cobalt-zinc-cadmium efflux system protein [Sediminitomix flava]